jgi:hypothetical protein
VTTFRKVRQVKLASATVFLLASSLAIAQSPPANPAPVVPLGRHEVIEEITPETLARLAARRERQNTQATPVALPAVEATAAAAPSAQMASFSEGPPSPPVNPFSATPAMASTILPSTPLPVNVFASQKVKFPYSPRQKFNLAIKDMYDPFNFMAESLNALYYQAKSDPYEYGGGIKGYGKRLGAIVANDVMGEFTGTFFFPTLLHTDPRYFRMEHGSVPRRFFYAVTRVVVTKKDSGGATFNTSKWLSGLATTSLANTYYPDRGHSFADNVTRNAINIGFDSLNNVFREFWPDIAHTLRIPAFVIRRTEDPLFPANDPQPPPTPAQKK